LRLWFEGDGAVRLDALLAPDDAAPLVAVVQGRAAALQEQARRSGHSERAEAYAADALVGLAKGEAGPTTVLHLNADAEAWERGHTQAGETCAIEGVGPIPVASARRLAAQGIVKAVLSDGADVTAVAHVGRHIPARIRTALEARDPTCVVPGCDMRLDLEIDHIIPVSARGPTKLSNLARLCRHHHFLKTHRGWRLGGEPGAWTFTEPGRSREHTRERVERAPPARSG
jgi:HNH endonuclease